MKASRSAAAPGRALLALALVTASLLAYEVLLPRVIAIQHWHHLTEVVIAVALLGMACAAVAVAALGERLARHLPWLLPASALATAAAMPLGLLLAGRVPLNMLALPWYTGQAGYLLAYALCFLLPFFGGGLFVTLTFVRWSRAIAACYAADLIGSAIGVVLVLAWLNSDWRGVATLESSVTLCALFALLAGLISTPLVAGLRLVASAVLALALSLLGLSLAVAPSNFKSLAVQLNERGARVLSQGDSIQSRLTRVRSPAQHLAPGLSLASELEAPVQELVFTDGEGARPLLLAAEDPVHGALYSQSLEHLAYLVAPLHPRVLILPGNPSWRAWGAHWHGARAITLVEPDRHLGRLLQRARARDYLPPHATVLAQQPRRALAAGDRPYDLLLGEIDSDPVGSAATRIQPLLTRQALSLMLDRLAPRGILAFSGQLMPLPRDSLRLVNSLAVVLASRGLPPARHLMAIRDWRNYLVLVSAQPFNRDQVNATARWSRRWQFDPVVLPGRAVERAALFHRTPGDRFLEALPWLLSPARERFVADYPFDLSVTDDSRPFFHHFFRWSHWRAVSEALGPPWPLYVGWGYLLSLAALAVLAPFAGLLLLPPLAAGPLRGAMRGCRLSVTAYFGAIGLGFMFFEIALIQNAVLLTDSYTEAFALVLVAVLLGAGLGSAAAGSRVLPARTAWLAIASIVAGTLFYPALLEQLFALSVAWPSPLRLGTLALILVLPAFPMGTLLPQGIAAIRHRGDAAVAWSWGINGFFSVCGALAAPLIAIEMGWPGLSACAAGLYLLAGWSRGHLR